MAFKPDRLHLPEVPLALLNALVVNVLDSAVLDPLSSNLVGNFRDWSFVQAEVPSAPETLHDTAGVILNMVQNSVGVRGWATVDDSVTNEWTPVSDTASFSWAAVDDSVTNTWTEVDDSELG